MPGRSREARAGGAYPRDSASLRTIHPAFDSANSLARGTDTPVGTTSSTFPADTRRLTRFALLLRRRDSSIQVSTPARIVRGAPVTSRIPPT